MTIASLPLVSALRQKMLWHQARQKVLAENVANANTPGFQPKDLRDLAAPGSPSPPAGSVRRTDPRHLVASSDGVAEIKAGARFETRPSGNAVTVEDEMLRIADNQSQYQLAASLYQKSLALLRSAAGVRGA